jgi:preprotein translocase subunit SecE
MPVRRHQPNRKATEVTENNTPDVVAGKANSEGKTGVVARVSRFLREVIIELRKVVTPTRKELINFTIVVLVFVVIVMTLITSLDFVIGLLTGFIFGDGTFAW